MCESCVLQKLRKLMLPDSCLFSNFQLPVAPDEWPPPNPRWGRHSAAGWNLRSEPPDVTPYFCRGGADKISRVSFRRHVTNTNLRDRKRYPAPLRCPWLSESFPAVTDVRRVQRREIHCGYRFKPLSLWIFTLAAAHLLLSFERFGTQKCLLQKKYS